MISPFHAIANDTHRRECTRADASSRVEVADETFRAHALAFGRPFADDRHDAEAAGAARAHLMRDSPASAASPTP